MYPADFEQYASVGVGGREWTAGHPRCHTGVLTLCSGTLIYCLFMNDIGTSIEESLCFLLLCYVAILLHLKVVACVFTVVCTYCKSLWTLRLLN